MSHILLLLKTFWSDVREKLWWFYELPQHSKGRKFRLDDYEQAWKSWRAETMEDVEKKSLVFVVFLITDNCRLEIMSCELGWWHACLLQMLIHGERIRVFLKVSALRWSTRNLICRLSVLSDGEVLSPTNDKHRRFSGESKTTWSLFLFRGPQS